MSPQDQLAFRKFSRGFSIAVLAIAMLPWLIGWLATPPGGTYLGYQYNTDDHMVYAAWMRQAAEGHWLLTNRFTTDPQPGQTIHIYFTFLGLISRVLGMFTTVALARVAFGFLFLQSLAGLIRRAGVDIFTAKIALVLATLGGGLGFMVWHNYGLLVTRPLPSFLSDFFGGRLPIDVWQPEAFVFPSLLTNGLFLVSGSLILTIFNAVLDAQSERRAVLPGLLAFAVLMNIHSYDVLLIGLVLVTFAVASWRSGHLTIGWLGRVAAMVLGVIPAALWFWHVLRVDPVFQARAATPTFSPPVPVLLLGIFPLLVGMALKLYQPYGKKSMAAFGIAATVALALAAYFTRGWPIDSAEPALWIALFAGALFGAAFLHRHNPCRNLLIAWTLTGISAPFFPALFQRKLTMLIAIPVAILAAIGLAQAVSIGEKSKRSVAVAALIVLCSASSLQWFVRELLFVRTNVSNTTRHPVFLNANVTRIVNALAEIPSPKSVLCLPGVASAVPEQPDVFASPLLPDLAPIVTGLAGATSYAGHWSETPRYAERANEATAIFLTKMPDSERRTRLGEYKIDYVVAPVPEAYPGLPLADLRELGDLVVDGPQFRLIRLRPAGQ